MMEYLIRRKIIIYLYYRKNEFGISFLDVSTGDFYVSQDLKLIDQLISNFSPNEILV